MTSLIRSQLIACLFLISPFIVFAQKADTIVDSHYTWAELQKKFIDYYTDSVGDKLPSYQKQNAILWVHEKLSLVNVVYVGYDNRIHAGQIVCHQAIANDIKQIFSELLLLRFPIYQCKPISDFGFTDINSMQANNTNGFDYRLKTDSRAISKHSYGLAIDMNPVENPYKKGGQILPYNTDESKATGRIRMTEETGRKVISIFRRHGWGWGGNWRSLKDYMHFEKQ